jgi:hypothetical protein
MKFIDVISEISKKRKNEATEMK